MGCLVLAQRNEDHAKISYTDTIAPPAAGEVRGISCEGGIGPWSMSSYEMVRGFAPMMREVIRTKRMPPWHADPHIGAWKNDKSLSVEQARRWYTGSKLAPFEAPRDPLKIS